MGDLPTITMEFISDKEAEESEGFSESSLAKTIDLKGLVSDGKVITHERFISIVNCLVSTSHDADLEGVDIDDIMTWIDPNDFGSELISPDDTGFVGSKKNDLDPQSMTAEQLKKEVDEIQEKSKDTKNPLTE